MWKPSRFRFLFHDASRSTQGVACSSISSPAIFYRAASQSAFSRYGAKSCESMSGKRGALEVQSIIQFDQIGRVRKQLGIWLLRSWAEGQRRLGECIKKVGGAIGLHKHVCSTSKHGRRNRLRIGYLHFESYGQNISKNSESSLLCNASSFRISNFTSLQCQFEFRKRLWSSRRCISDRERYNEQNVCGSAQHQKTPALKYQQRNIKSPNILFLPCS